MQASRGNRTGRNFTVRISEAEFEALAAAGLGTVGPRKTGPWLLWRALARSGIATGAEALPTRAAVLFADLGSAKAGGEECHLRRPGIAAAAAVPGPRAGNARKIASILDLCAGSGSWSRPYEEAGYQVDRVTLPESDVTTFEPAKEYDGVMAAPPCAEFSIAKTCGQGRDIAAGLVCVVHCMRIIALARPKWWALENPGTGLLRAYLGKPRMTFQPHDFGDTHTKLTSLWGNFALPAKDPVKPTSRMIGRNSHERAITPQGFARAFFLANP